MSSKIHLLCDQKGLPLKLILTAGQVADVTQAQALIAGRKAKYVLADRGYTSHALMLQVYTMGATPVIPPRRGTYRVYPFSKKIYKARNVIERAVNKLKHFRRVATRFEKNAVNFLAMLHLAAAQLWLR